jgi:D-3-phosphoglycerate dehydrogenase
MAKFKVYISDYDYPDNAIEKRILEPIGAEVIGLKCKSGEGLAEQAHDADAILQQYAKITRETLEKMPNLKIVARYGIGLDILDVEACRDRGVIVTNVPDYCIDEVADHAISFSLSLMRSLPHYNKKVREGSYQWQDWLAPIPRFRGATYGLIGFGRIAQNLARKLQAFGFKILAYDPFISPYFMATHGVQKAELEDIFKVSDVVNVLAPYNQHTHHMVNASTLALMKPTAYLVCVSRGKCVDNQALYQALKNGVIAGAALDDPEEEPMKVENWTPAMNPLFTLDNCYFTPHTAYVNKVSVEECREVAANNVKAVLLGERPFDIVN